MKGGKQTQKWPRFFNIYIWGERGTWPPLLQDVNKLRTTVGLKLIRALTCGENSWLSNFWLDTDGRSMHTYCPNQLCALYAKGNKLRIQNTRTLFQKKDTANQMFQKTHVKILLMLSEYFSEQLKIQTKLTKLLGILGTQLRNCGSFQQRISG